MKLEGGSNVKSPWYYRTGIRPLAATRHLSWVSGTIFSHAMTTRAQTSVTSTLNIRLGSVQHFFRTTVVAVNAGLVGTSISYDSAVKGFSWGWGYTASANSTPAATSYALLGDHLTVSGDTVYIQSWDERTGGIPEALWNTVLSLEWYGK